MQRIAEVYVPAPGSAKTVKTSTESTNQVSITEVIYERYTRLSDEKPTTSGCK